MKNKIAVILLVGFVMAAVTGSCQEISISASVDRQQVSIDQQVVLSVKVLGNVSNIPQPQIPEIQGFNIYSSGQNQSVSIINGQMSSSLTFNFVLVPQRAGKYTIPSMSLRYGGKVYSTNPIDIEVVAGQAAPAPSQSHPSPQTPAPAQSGGQLFVVGSVDKQTAYVNEQVTYSFRFYRIVRLLSNPEYRPPEFTGFWVEDLPPQTTYYQVVNGQQYFVVELKTALFPTSPGNHTIGSASLICNIEDFSGNPDDFFRAFFTRGKTQTVSTEPITIKVLPLPSNGKPKSFTGMVGEYKISADVDKRNVECNQPITVKVSIAGKGNIKTISQPKFEKLKNLRKYETITSLNISKENYIVQGSKIYTTMLLPQVPGELEIPAMKTNYFDPAAKVYREIFAPAIKLKVSPSTKPAPKIPAMFAPKSTKFLDKDIRYIKTTAVFSKKGIPLYEKQWFLCLQFLPLFIILFVFLYSRHFNRLASDQKYARLHKAYATAAKILKNVEKNDPGQTACAVSGALIHYIADKLNLSAAGLTSAEIKAELVRLGIPQDTINDILSVMEKCDFARFAPAQISGDEAAVLYEKALVIIEALEKSLRKLKK